MLLIVAPILMLLQASVVAEEWGRPTRLTLEHYRTILATPRILRVLLNTAVVAMGATALAAVAGVTLAWLTARTDMPGARVLEPVNLIPFYLSPLSGAIAWIYLAAPRIGLLNGLAREVLGSGDILNVYGLGGMIWVLGLFFTPVIYLFVGGSLRRMDPALEESARVCGSGLATTTRRITLALVRPAVISGMILVFVSSVGEFSIPLTLGTPVGVDVLTTEIFAAMEHVPPNHNLAAALSTLLLSATIGLMLLQRRLLGHRRYTVIGGRGYRPTPIRLQRWRYLALAFNLLYILLAVVLPLVSLALVSVSRLWLGTFSSELFTWQNYRYILTEYPLVWTGIRNSATLAVVGATVAVSLGLLLSYLVHRTTSSLRRAVDIVSGLPVAVPGIVLAVGVLLVYIRTPLYATLWIILMAYLTRYLPYGHRPVAAALLGLSAELEDASRVAGAPWLTTLRRISIPLLKPGLLAGWIVLFIIYMREFPMSLLLARPGTETMSVALYTLLIHKPAPVTAAFALMQMLLLLTMVYVFRRVLAAEEGAPYGIS